MSDPIEVFATVDRRASTVQKPDDEWDGFEPHVISTRLADVQPEAVSWLWPDRIPYGKLTLLVGDPGVGKSFLTLDLAARLSTGIPWPDLRDAPIEPGNTVILSAEDDPADTIRPRLDAAGADVARIHAIRGVQRTPKGQPAYFCLDNDLGPLERCIGDTGARLCIIDPVSAYLGERDSHSNSAIRGLLAPLSDVAARNGCAVVAVTHLNKSGVARALYRAMGSLAFCAAARTAWLVARDKDDERRRLLLPLKSNLIENPSGLAFQIIDGVLQWFPERVDIDPDSVLASDGADRTERQAAEDWLTELLAAGPMAVREIQKAAQADCHSWRTVERAKRSLGLRVFREGFGSGGRFTWSLPDVAADGDHRPPAE